MIQATILPRVFTFKNNGQNQKLTDPDPSLSPEEVLNHYIPHFPILATATVYKPVIGEDEVIIEFSPSVGTKG